MKQFADAKVADRGRTSTISADPEISLGTLVTTIAVVRGPECIDPVPPDDPRCPFGEVILDVELASDLQIKWH